MSDSETKTARGFPSSLSPRPCPGPFALTPARQARSRSSIPGPSAPAPRLPDCCKSTYFTECLEEKSCHTHSQITGPYILKVAVKLNRRL